MNSLSFSELARTISSDFIETNIKSQWPILAELIKRSSIPSINFIKNNGVILNSIKANYKIQWSFNGKELPNLFNADDSNVREDYPVVQSNGGFIDSIGKFDNELYYNTSKLESYVGKNILTPKVLKIIRRYVLEDIMKLYGEIPKPKPKFWFKNTTDRIELQKSAFYFDNDFCLFFQAFGWIEVKDELSRTLSNTLTFNGNPEVKIIQFDSSKLNQFESRFKSIGLDIALKNFENEAIKDGVYFDSFSQFL